jgi:hypothetical protein
MALAGLQGVIPPPERVRPSERGARIAGNGRGSDIYPSSTGLDCRVPSTKTSGAGGRCPMSWAAKRVWA